MSGSTVTLRHTSHTLPIRGEYFYDGQAVARDGVLTLPAEKVDWIKAAYLRGYNCDFQGKPLLPEALTGYIADQTAKSAKR